MEKNLDALRIDRSKKASTDRRRGVSWLVSGALLVIGLLLGFFLGGYFRSDQAAGDAEETTRSKSAQQASEPAAQTTTTGGATTLIASGYIVAHHKIEVGSKVMGKVAWIGVEKGDPVKRGQLLVRLDDREYRAQVEQAEAAVRAAEAGLRELEAGNRPEEIQRTEAELLRLRADLGNSQLELRRVESLLKSGAVSQQQVDNARSRTDMAEAAVRVAERNHDLMKLGPRQEQIALARAEVERNRAALRYAETLLDATRITAPSDGTVLERLVEMGEMVTTSFAGEMGAKSAVVSLADLKDLQVELDISQSDFNRIARDQECVMTPEAYPDRKYKCEIAEISPEANRQKATIQVKVQVLEPDEYLRPEMTARVTFSKATVTEAS